VGTLQRKKAAKAVGHFALIHSVDSLELATKLSLVSGAEKRQTPVLLQVNVSGEATKHGLSMEQWRKELDQLLALPHLRIQGLMTMAPLTAGKSLIRSTFAQLRTFRDELCARVAFPYELTHLSMGMTHDYKIAIEEGATLLRIGTAIFAPC
jgi:pyridoxal phosphate enzyme (YggS family)